jgi:hypothetical protein
MVLNLGEDQVSGAVTWQTFTRKQIEAFNVQASAAAARGDIRGYAMTPTEIDARIFGEYIARGIK